MKRKITMPSAYTTLLLIIIAVAILTWIVPAGTYEYVDPMALKLQPIPDTYSPAPQNPQGIWEILSAPIKGFFEAGDIILYVMVIGGFLGVVMKTGAIDAGIGATVRRLEGKEYVMIPILMILFGLGGTIFGMSEETIAFYLLIIPIFIAAGFDTVTAVAVVFLGSGLGCATSTVNPFSVGIASGFAGISIGDGLMFRALLFIIFEGLGTVFIMSYAKKIKADPSKSLVYEMKAHNERKFLAAEKNVTVPLTMKRRIILFIFSFTFFLLVLAVIPWSYKFGIHFFENLNNALIDLPLIGKFFGNLIPFGDWWFSELTVLFLVASVIIGLIAGITETEFVDTFLNGAKDLLGVALIIGVSRGIGTIMNDGGMTATVLHWGEETLISLGSVAFINLAYLFYLPLSFLVPSSTGLATLSMPILAPLADFANVQRDIIVTAYSTANGMMNIVSPTNGVLMGALAIAGIRFSTYLKFVWRLFLILTFTIMLSLSIAVLL